MWSWECCEITSVSDLRYLFLKCSVYLKSNSLFIMVCLQWTLNCLSGTAGAWRTQGQAWLRWLQRLQRRSRISRRNRLYWAKRSLCTWRAFLCLCSSLGLAARSERSSRLRHSGLPDSLTEADGRWGHPVPSQVKFKPEREVSSYILAVSMSTPS